MAIVDLVSINVDIVRIRLLEMQAEVGIMGN